MKKGEKVKVLVLNPSTKNVSKAINIINQQNKKAGPFSFSILLGDVFPSKDFVETGDLTVNIPTYFTEGEHGYNSKIELPENLVHLGEIGVYKLVNGLKIGYVFGNLKNITSNDILEKFKGQSIDIMMTYLWPDAIAREENLLLSGDPKLDILISELNPQYWFSCGGENGKYFERKPYIKDGKITRFISLATMGENRCWYAFQIGPIRLNSNQNIDATPPPIINKPNGEKRKLELNENENETSMKRSIYSNKTKLEITPESCFLCLSNPKFELHMIVSIAKYAYLTVSKGPLTLPKPLGFSGHGMIVPIEHFPTMREYVKNKKSSLKVQDSSLFKEVQQFQESLVEMFRNLGDYSVIFWEISRKRSVHGHIQFVPVQDMAIVNFRKVLDNQIEYDKRFYPESLKVREFGNEDKLEELNEVINNQDYVLFTIYGKEGITKYLIELGNDDDRFFDAQFPRKVVAVLLNLKNRIHWTKCIETKEQESIQKAEFQTNYDKYDIMKNI
ncbi:Drn1 protein [Pichia kluyveri]|uniref:Drn1 protein n=1 Tax=Pichia kluyveri TaxID=36015 RepID=A0AAV5QX34_PICKL|nr:Drn1 protein [Pichia kluyveri]